MSEASLKDKPAGTTQSKAKPEAKAGKDKAKIADKKNDYRIKVYKTILKQVQIIKLFTTKKCIRKYKQNAEHLQAKDQQTQQKLIEKLTKRANNINLRLSYFKDMSSKDLKLISLYFLCHYFEIDPSVQNTFFVKEIGEDYRQQTEQITQQIEAVEENGQSHL